jgi:prevent-host-death family protein
MNVSLTEDIKSVSDLKQNTRQIFEQLHKTGRPIVVTINGKPDAILLDVEVFEKKLKTLNLAYLLEEAEEDVRKNRVRPVKDFLREFKKRAKI